MIKNMKITPAMKLLGLVWQQGMKDTWQRINYSMRDALSLAIAGGLGFTAKDFASLGKFSSHYWVGADDEWIYTSAIINGNKSCIEAFEEWKGRTPFRANNVRKDYCGGSYLHANSMNRERERLAVGFTFTIEGQTWEVTKFEDDKGTVRAVRRSTPKKLKAFTHEEIAVLFPSKSKGKTGSDLDKNPTAEFKENE